MRRRDQTNSFGDQAERLSHAKGITHTWLAKWHFADVDHQYLRRAVILTRLFGRELGFGFQKADGDKPITQPCGHFLP